MKKITHADGSVSYIKGSVTIVKNKENIEDQKVEEVDDKDIHKKG